MQSALCLPELQVGSTCRREYWHLILEQRRLTSVALINLNTVFLTAQLEQIVLTGLI